MKQGDGKLKPCPFCGTIPTIDTNWKCTELVEQPVMRVTKRVRIVCHHCACQKDLVAYRDAPLGLDENEYRKIAREIGKHIINRWWNWRFSN